MKGPWCHPIGRVELDRALEELIEVHLDFESFAQKYQHRLDESTNRLATLLADRGIVTDWRHVKEGE